MSEFHVVEVCFKNEAVLVKSLKEMGYNPAVHNESVVLGGSYNRNNVKAHIVVSKSQFNGSYGDLGFERTKEGFVMHADHIDKNKFKLKQLNKCYGENMVKK